MANPTFKRPGPKDPIYVLFRYGRPIYTDGNVPRIFFSPEHYDWYRNRYPTTFLSTDVLVKYVPVAEDPKMEED